MTPVDGMSARMLELGERLRQVEAERDELRKALERIVTLAVLQINKPGTQAAREVAAAALERAE